MGCFKICDVKGDGHCYYRCIYRVAKECQEVADALYVNDMSDEDNAVREIRQYVSLSLKCEKPSQNVLDNIVSIYRQVPDIGNDYPLLSKIDDIIDDRSSQKIYETVCAAIEDTNMMASSFEHEIVSSRLRSVSHDAAVELHLLVLHKQVNETIADLADKWLRQLSVILKTVDCGRVAILINEDNIHYKYAKFHDRVIISKRELISYVDEQMAEDSQEDE